MHITVPLSRIRLLNARDVNPGADFVLYWMTSARRLRRNFGLQRAVDLCLEFKRPLVILEPLRCDYPFASDRLHTFVIQGMVDNEREASRSRALYYPYVEPRKHAGRGLLAALSRHACAIVADWYPAFFLPHMLAAGGRDAEVRLEAVDSNGLLPLSDHGRAFTSARAFRAYVQRTLRRQLGDVPEETPLSRLPRIAPPVLPRAIGKRWSRASARLLSVDAPVDPSAFPIDYAVPAVPTRGGARAAGRALRRFIQTKLGGYGKSHNHPDDEGTSRLSPYLHFGHVSAHDVFTAVMTRERWTTRKLAARGGGTREGWWGVSPSAEVFLDQLAVWRELAFNGCEYLDDVTGYESLPDWARRTLESHLDDPRPHTYSMTQLENARTSDEVWNAAQRQLVSQGWMHGYMRMLWGKKILEWSEHPSEALTRMRLLMDRHALDGRDPNSYAGYAWVLGRYDRPWPERPVFGTVRCMTSASALRKLRMRHYLETYSAR